MKLLPILLMLVSTAHAEVTATVALGKKVIEKEPFERAASIGYKIPLSSAWFVKPEIGGWIGGPGKSSWYVGAPIGVQAWVPNTGAFLSVAVGPSYISQPDNILGHHAQCDIELGGGLKTEKATIGFMWKHFSNAGVFGMPNVGRDFIGITVGVEL